MVEIPTTFFVLNVHGAQEYEICFYTVTSRETWESSVVGIASQVVTSICDHSNSIFAFLGLVCVHTLYLITTRLLLHRLDRYVAAATVSM